MKIGIIVHSKSGHTFNIARRIADKCNSIQAETDIIRLKPEGDIHPGSKNISIPNLPDIEKFDLLIFGAPVWAFSASPVIVTYLNQIGDCKGKKILCFVTMGFPFSFLGGKQAINKMNKIVSKTGGTILPAEIITLSSGISEAKLNLIIDRIFQNIKRV